MEETNKNKFLEEYGRKLQVLAFAGVLLLVSYLFLRFLLPIFWPFIAGLALALFIKPVVNFLSRFFHLNRMVGTAIVIIILAAVITGLSGLFVRGLLSQIRVLMDNMDGYKEAADQYLCDICCSFGDAVGVEGMSLFSSVSHSIDDFIMGLENKITSFIMGTSIPAIIGVIDFIIGIALAVVSLFLFVKDRDNIRAYVNNCYFSRELKFVLMRTVSAVKAYVKAQFIIMAVVAAECVAGLMLIGNKYALLIGVLIGLLDALPLFGVGTVLIPWAIIYIAGGNFVKAAIIFTVFMVCYFTREFLEPRLIGNKIGIHPIVTLVAIYAGYKLLGFIGMFLAPLVYILVRDATVIFERHI